MATGSNRRRRGGHPAKQAERRERDRLRRETPADPLRRAAATIRREAGQLGTALDAELWASALLGTWWPPPFDVMTDYDDADLAIGGPLVDEIARIGGPEAVGALLALGEVSESELGLRALDHVNRLLAAGVARPPWGQAILEAEVLGTAVLREDVFDDGVTIFIEAAHDGGQRHAVGVYIDHNLGGRAKDIVMADSIAAVEELAAASAGERVAMRVEPIAPGEAAIRIRDAMELTDMTLEAAVGEDYAALRSLAILRADELVGPFPEVSMPEVSAEEREALRTDFLDSPEGATFAADGDEAFVASLAIDFCADYLDGRPLRWSPVVVEVFMTDWIPRKVMADRPTFDVVPAALAAWVRYAGRRRQIPGWAIAETRDAIDTWADEMFELLDGGEAAGPAKAFLAAAKAAGVDVTDDRALATFVAGWNARSAAP